MSLLDELLPAEGEVIGGRYRIVDRIGRGSFGVVYRAEMESLGSEVAVKVLMPHIADEPRARQRFEQEIAIVRNLHHPNTIRVLDVARTERGLPLYVMELLHGEPLSDLLSREGGLPDTRVARMARQILGALAEAHQKGVVHRDLKPANVMLCDIVGAPDFVKVLDFGVAKTADGGPTATQTGAVIGTPFYMSPEQASGRRDLDGRSDLYSLGILMAEALGAPPNVRDLDPLEHLAAHLADEPLPFPEHLRASALWPVIECATSKSRAARYENARAMGEAIDAVSGRATDEVPGVIAAAPPGYISHASDPALVDTYAVADSAELRSTPAEPDDRGSDVLAPAVAWRGAAGRVAVGAAAVLALVGVALVSRGGAPPTPTKSIDAGAVVAPPVARPQAEPGREAPDPAPEPDPAGLEARAAIDRAAAALGTALPAAHRVDVVGPDGASVIVAGRDLGALPLVLDVPAIEADVEVTVRRGRSERTRPMSLTAPTWSLTLPEPVATTARHHAASAPGPDPTEPVEPEATPEPPPAPGSPFGAAPIHD